MSAIAQNQLKCVLARRQFYRGFGLSLAEMKVVLIARNRLCEICKAHIYKKMVMAGVFQHPARWGYGYAADAEFDF